jgi:hypothetical protein
MFITVNCGTPTGLWGPGEVPPSQIPCCSTLYYGCCDTRLGVQCPPISEGGCPCYQDCYGPASFLDEDYSNDCANMKRMRNQYRFVDPKTGLRVRFPREKKIQQPIAKNYHDFFGFTEDDYNYEFLINDSINALNLLDGNCQIPCQRDLKIKLTFSGCCFSCVARGKADCRPEPDCFLGGFSDPRRFEVLSCYAAIGDGTVNVSLPSIPCGQLHCYINGKKGTSAFVKDCHNFCITINGIFSRYDCCACCLRAPIGFKKHNWSYAGFREYKKGIIQKNLANKMKKIKF